MRGVVLAVDEGVIAEDLEAAEVAEAVLGVSSHHGAAEESRFSRSSQYCQLVAPNHYEQRADRRVRRSR